MRARAYPERIRDGGLKGDVRTPVESVMPKLGALLPPASWIAVCGIAILPLACQPRAPADGACPTGSGGTGAAAQDAGTQDVDAPDAATPSSVLPSLTAIHPSTGAPYSYTTVTLTGTGFTAASTVAATDSTGASVAVSNVVFHDSTSLSATLFLSATAQVAPNAVTAVSVSTNGARSGTVSFTTAPAEIVIHATDNAAGTPAGTGAGEPGDLRYTMLHAASGATIVFATDKMCGASSCMIQLNGPLPPVEHDVTIDGGGAERIAVDGNGRYRAFFVDTGTVSLQKLTVQNTAAVGGAGGASLFVCTGGAGGGLGAGASLFVNRSTAQVNIADVTFANAVAVGGAGGASGTATNAPYTCGAGGGGGMAGKGGDVTSSVASSCGGGGGMLGDGQDASGSGAGNGGVGGGGGGGAAVVSVGAAGPAYGSNAAGQAGGANGGNGGFGGGAGGCDAATGGFGGGGSGVQLAADGVAIGGLAGAGGGGSGCTGGFGGVGAARSGGALATLQGGTGGACGGGAFDGEAGGGGGGGAAAGPAIFVNLGSLTIANSRRTGVFIARGGTGGAGAPSGVAHGDPSGSAGSAGHEGASDATPVFNNGGTVNGATTLGGIEGAL